MLGGAEATHLPSLPTYSLAIPKSSNTWQACTLVPRRCLGPLQVMKEAHRGAKSPLWGTEAPPGDQASHARRAQSPISPYQVHRAQKSPVRSALGGSNGASKSLHCAGAARPKLLQGYGATNGFNVSLGLVGIFLLGAFEQD